MRSRSVRALVVCAALLSLVIHRGDSANAVSSGIVISQVYGGGGNTSAPAATLKNDFIELYNRGSVAVTVTGWSVQYASSTGSSWQSTPLTGVIEPGAYYLVQEAQGSGGTVSLPTPNAIGTISMAAGAGKVALVGSTALLTGTCPLASTVDFVGFGTGTNCVEGAGPTGTLSNVNAAFRVGGGTQDTDNNAGDFVVALASPRNSPQNTAPTGILSATPSSAATGATVLLTVSVTPGTNPPSTGITVTGALQAIGGNTAQDFAQDPVDANKFTFSATIGAAVTSGAKTVSGTIADSQGRSSTAQTTVTVTSPTDTAPGVTSTNPGNGATNVPVDANIVIGFSESVTATAAFSIQCPAGSPQAFTQSASPNSSFTLNPTVDLPYATTCTVRVTANQVFDTDTADPPDTMTADVSVTFTTEHAPVQSNSFVVISQLYGGGGNSNATYQNDFVELYNRSTGVVNVTGWSIQYASTTGSGWNGPTAKTPLYGTIAPGEYYLVALATGGNVGADLPAANISGPTNMSGTAGKVALVDNLMSLVGNCPISDPHVLDFVGYGPGSDCKEGQTVAPAASNTTSLLRKDNGQFDTDNNGGDFVVGTPAPRQTAPIVTIEVGPQVAATDPRSGATTAPRDATIEVSFNEPVDVEDGWFDISCTTTGPHVSVTTAVNGKNRYITPNDNFLAGEQCTVTIFKDQVHDEDLDDILPNTDTLPANVVWSFTVATGTDAPFPTSVHLTMGNPSGAVADLIQPNNYLMEKPEFALSYNRDNGRPNWVSWHLSTEWVGSLVRVDTFRADPAVPADWYRVQSFDFVGSGFDRGHMVPNADRDHEDSIPINQATFLMSNMIAQAPDNNQGPWAELENYLRTLLPANEIYVVAGGTGAGGTGSTGVETTTLANGHVKVPQWTWKAALVIPAGGGDDISRVTCSARTIAVIMPNVQGIRNVDWQLYLKTVNEVEDLTGYNLFSNLPQPIQNCVEAGVNGVNPKNGQSISVPTIDPRTFADGDFTVDATGGDSGNPVTFTASGVCASTGPNGATITVTAAGACTVTASQAGDVNYEPAIDVSHTVTIGQAAATFTGLSSPAIEAGSGNVTIAGTLSIGNVAPTGSVAMTLNGTTVNAAIGANGQFSATLPSATLTPSGSPHTVTFAYEGDTNFTSASGASTVTVADTTAPVITLTGGATLTVDAGTTFTDPGATATDSFAGNLTGAIQTTGTVNTSVVGSYTRTYTVTDGFNTTTATRAVQVIDTTAPAIAGLGTSQHLFKVQGWRFVNVTVPYQAADAAGPPVCTLSVSPVGPVHHKDGLNWYVLGAHHVVFVWHGGADGKKRQFDATASCADGTGNQSSATTRFTLMTK